MTDYEISIANDFCNLTFHRQSIKGLIRDYIISFNEDETDLELVIGKTLDVFVQLMERFKENRVKARIIAEIEFARVNNENEVATFHFASYQADWVNDSEQFYVSHFQKIISRLDQFNNRGSNLLIRRIKHIHLALNVISTTKSV